MIDIGSGTGYLFKWLKERGARDISGIDPAETNIKTSTESYPWATSHLASLEEFAGREEKYDTALAVMVLEHFEDLASAFNQMNRLLVEDGKLVVVIGDKDDELSTEAGQGKHIVSAEIVHEFADGAVEVRVERRLGSGNTSVIFDILRSVDLVCEYAHSAGFELVKKEPIMSKLPSQEGRPIFHMLMFAK